MTDDPDLVRRFKEGERHGKDPSNYGTDGPGVTTADSIWLADWCRTCGHTFRQGDPVYVRYGPPLVVRHHSPALPCSGEIEEVQEAGSDERSKGFHAALDRANPPPDGLHTVRLVPGHPLLVEMLPRLHCVWCSMSFRPFELALLCPCSPEAPKCRLGVHRDPGKGQDCYDAWISNGRLRHCPTSLQKLDDG